MRRRGTSRADPKKLSNCLRVWFEINLLPLHSHWESLHAQSQLQIVLPHLACPHRLPPYVLTKRSASQLGKGTPRDKLPPRPSEGGWRAQTQSQQISAHLLLQTSSEHHCPKPLLLMPAVSKLFLIYISQCTINQYLSSINLTYLRDAIRISLQT